MKNPIIFSKVFFILAFVSLIVGFIVPPPINYFIFGFAVLMVIIGSIFSEMHPKDGINKETRIEALEKTIEEEQEKISKIKKTNPEENDEYEIKSKIQKQLEAIDKKIKKEIPEERYLDLTEEKKETPKEEYIEVPYVEEEKPKRRKLKDSEYADWTNLPKTKIVEKQKKEVKTPPLYIENEEEEDK